MKKAKHKRTKKGNSSNAGIDENEDDWVIVKKQKIIIIVPPSPLPVHKKRSVLKPRHVSTKRGKTIHPQKHKHNSPTVPNLKQKRSSPILRTSPNVLHCFTGESMDQRIPSLRPTVFRRSICLSVTAIQNRMMRASNLERKLVKAGGLNRWLVSLDLGRFVKMFRSRNVDKFQLLSLTMEKLKDMGVNAVGPRRKLMHAIDCINHPCCFSTR